MGIGGIYKGYLKSMALLGRRTKWLSSREIEGDSASDSGASEIADTDFDGKATFAGNQYRALGTLVGFFGIAIVLLAIAPIGMQVQHQTEHVLGWIKVGLMVLMLVLVLYGGNRKLKSNWIEWRVKAEDLRYRHLFDSVAEMSRVPNVALRDKLLSDLIKVLDGADGQIAYDEGKAAQYQSIESFADVLLWISVGLAFFAAVVHLYFPYPWLIFFTAFGPALVGGIHGINAFLCVGELAKKHETAGIALGEYFKQLKSLDTPNNKSLPTGGANEPNTKLTDEESNAVLTIAMDVLRVLTERDIKWKALVAEVAIKPT